MWVNKTVKKIMNKDYCRGIDRSPRYYNSGEVREIPNIMSDDWFNLNFAYNSNPVLLSACNRGTVQS